MCTHSQVISTVFRMKINVQLKKFIIYITYIVQVRVNRIQFQIKNKMITGKLYWIKSKYVHKIRKFVYQGKKMNVNWLAK